MLIIGLTGSIATGKSTVSSILSQPPYNLPIVDADLLARKVVEPGTAGYNAIVKHFEPSTPDLLLPPSDQLPINGPDGKGRPLNRPALGRRVFGESEDAKRNRAVLNGIVHPAVRKAMFFEVLKAWMRGYWAVVMDVPLLFESKLDRFCGAVVVVAVRDPEIQMGRLRKRDPHLSAEDAENRVRSQGDVRDKARRAEARGKGKGVVVWNDGALEELKGEIERAVGELRGGRPDWWSWLMMFPPLGVLVAGWEFWRNRGIDADWERKEARERAKL
ncbi:dephospho-CoA kinase-domain-containing protein [Rhypophila decipiens]|uniref:Dephospho-CoA kinase-domain-containing protein n=1 Tax=Rhypophila decipiens TaxID=261697 RepID=A0AAN6Y5K5_9PEZI|nr:dephospho-CoA kinase-domain-containing protein [Rhypophila decipiens]